jgi:predicted TIM-barrel fold metal-dependent hydrolase
MAYANQQLDGGLGGLPMSEAFMRTTRPKPADDDATTADANWTDCDLASFVPERADTLAASGITRAVIGRLPNRSATLSPEPEQDLIATRFVIDAPPDPDPATLRDLHAQGVRGIRFTVAADADQARSQLDDALRYADRIAGLPWHVEFDLGSSHVALLAANEWTLTRFPVAICLSRFADFACRRNLDDPDIGFMLALLQMGRTWLKWSGADVHDALQAFISAAIAVRRDRLLWGSGIPAASDAGQDRASHVSRALALLTQWIPDRDERDAVLTANPSLLYGF